MKERCAHCNEEHDLSQLEPSHAMPDVVHQMGDLERRQRVRMNKDICLVRSDTIGSFHGRFLRVLLPIPVAGRDPCRWGVWVQVEEGTFEQVLEVWDKDERTGLIWSGQLANELPGYAKSLGLFGTFQFRNLTDIPYLKLGEPGQRQHQLIRDQNDGVPSTRALEWLLSIHHPESTS